MTAYPKLAVLLLCLGLSAAASVVAFALMWVDKGAAIRGRRRVPESTLHALELLGGWPGSLAGQRLFRHKTAKLRYAVTFWLAALVHVGSVSALVWAT